MLRRSRCVQIFVQTASSSCKPPFALYLLSDEYRCLVLAGLCRRYLRPTVVLSAPVSILNPNPIYLPLPLGILYFNQNVPLFIGYNIITFLVFYLVDYKADSYGNEKLIRKWTN